VERISLPLFSTVVALLGIAAWWQFVSSGETAKAHRPSLGVWPFAVGTGSEEILAQKERVRVAATWMEAIREMQGIEDADPTNPKSDALVPDLIDRIPLDVMDGQPLRYHQSETGGYLLWSIGRNRIDHGGKSDPKAKRHQSPDWVSEIPP
jgi:hypothetical protein